MSAVGASTTWHWAKSALRPCAARWACWACPMRQMEAVSFGKEKLAAHGQRRRGAYAQNRRAELSVPLMQWLHTFAPDGARWQLALVLFCSLTPVGHAALFEDGEARRAILEMRQRVDAAAKPATPADDLRRSGEDTSQLRRSLLDLQTQIEVAARGDAKLRGQNEQLTRDVSELQRLQKETAKAWTSAYASSSRGKVTVDGQEFQADPAEKQDFEAALAKFREGKFADAERPIPFLRQYPRSGYLPSARFWLGNAQYATRDYKEAIGNFKALLASAPNHARAPEAALSIANCQMELKETTRRAQNAGRPAAGLSPPPRLQRRQRAALASEVSAEFGPPSDGPADATCRRCSSAGLVGLIVCTACEVPAVSGQAHVVVVGIGGVGSWAAEALARSGVGQPDVDRPGPHCRVQHQPANPCAGSHCRSGQGAGHARAYCRQINPACVVHCIEDFVEPAIGQPCCRQVDGVIDACDQVQAKTAMAHGRATPEPCSLCGRRRRKAPGAPGGHCRPGAV
jgi:TolA-binding protein